MIIANLVLESMTKDQLSELRRELNKQYVRSFIRGRPNWFATMIDLTHKVWLKQWNF